MAMKTGSVKCGSEAASEEAPAAGGGESKMFCNTKLSRDERAVDIV
jgi:hypothetical protein